MAAPYSAYKIIRSELGSDYSHRVYEPYHGISSVFISNKTVSVARKLRWSTKPASRHTRGAGRNRTLLLILILILILLSSGRLAQ